MPLPRKKSCARCRESKLRCDLGLPTCSRCSARMLQCVYDGCVPDRQAPYPYHPSANCVVDPLSLLGTDEPVAVNTETDPAAALNVDTVPSLDDDFLNLDTDALRLDLDISSQLGGFSSLNPKTPSVDTLEHQPDLGLNRPFGLDHVPPRPAATQLDPSINESSPIQPIPFLQGLSPFLSPTTSGQPMALERTSDRRDFTRRRILRNCIMTSVAMGQLTSYPKMLVEGDRLPPFIHPTCYVDEELAPRCTAAGRHLCLHETLANCGSLVEMFYARTPANADFVWKTIYREAARLWNEFSDFDHAERLAALQCLTVFALLQADDPQSVGKNDSRRLLVVPIEMLAKLYDVTDWRNDHAKRPRRSEWVVIESLRRVVAIFCVVDLLLDGMGDRQGSCKCGESFLIAPLPCIRDMWEARTTKAWVASYDRYLSTRITDTLLTAGHLMETIRVPCETDPVNGEVSVMPCLPDVMKWCEGMDVMGTLVWMVMPLQRMRRQDKMREVW